MMFLTKIRIWIFIFTLLFSILCVYSDNSASINNVQKGSFSFASASTDITINSVNRSRSILVFSYTINNAGPSQFLMRGDLSSDTNIHFERVGGSGTVEVVWYVAEFDRGVNTQSGTITQGATTTTTINSINRSKSFPIISFENNGGAWGSDDHVRALITTNTNLETRATASLSNTLAWQVIEYSNASVQEGTVSLSGTTTTANINNVNLSKAFVITTSYASANTGADDGGLFTNFTNSTELSFQREANGGTLEIGYHVIEFQGDEKVFSGTANFDTSTTDLDITLPQSINLNRSIAFTSDNFKGGKGTETNDNPGTIWSTVNLTNSTNLHLHRALTGGDTADVSWYIVEFAKVYLKPELPTPSLTSVDGSDNTTSNLNCSTLLLDPNPLSMNVTVNWYESDSLQFTNSYNNSYSNGTIFSAILGFGNTSVNDFWKCEIRIDNGHKQTQFVNSTVLRIIDPNAPTINITFPQSNFNYTSLITDLNHSIFTLNTLDQCWYSTNLGVTNTTYTCGTNITGLIPNQGSNTWTIYANDTLGNQGFEFVTFFVDTIGPAITINSPSGNIIDYTPALNITLFEIVDTLWYSINSSSTNITICNNCNETQIEYLVLEENSYTITVYANDTLGNLRSNITITTLETNLNLFDNLNDNSSVIRSNNIISNGNNITFTGGNKILQVALICAAATCTDTNKDVPVENHLTNSMGYNVTTFAGTDTTWNTSNYDLAIISESVNSGDTAWLKSEAIPILTIEGANWDEFDLGTNGNSASGTDTNVNITNNSHYITQTFSTGVTTIATTASNLGDMSGWSQDIVKLAHFDSSPTLAFLLIVESGGTLVDLTLAAQKRAFLASQYFNNLNSNGEEIFNRTVDWLGNNTNKENSGNFTFHKLNVTESIANFTNITWDEFGIGGGNDITLQVSVNNGLTWYNATNGYGLYNFTSNNSLLVRVLFSAINYSTLTIDNINISWNEVVPPLPDIMLISPTNNSKDLGDNIIEFKWYVGGTPINTCTIYVDGIPRDTSVCLGDSNRSINLTITGNNPHTWYVNVTDALAQTHQSETWNFYNILNYSVLVEKSISNVNTNQYFINTKLTNRTNFFYNYSYIDFIPSNFTLGSETPSFSFFNITNGPYYFGRTYVWNINTTIQEVNYSLAGVNKYHLKDAFIVALD